MRIVLPITVPTKPSFGEVKRRWFSKDNVGTYRCELDQLHQNLSETFVEVQKCGWQVDSIVPIAGGVYHFDVKEPNFVAKLAGGTQFTGAGYGFGLSATEAIILICSRTFSGEQLKNLFEIVKFESEARRNIQQLEKYKTEVGVLRETEKEIRDKTVAPVKEGIRRQIVAWQFDGQRYPNEADANEAKQAMTQSVFSQIAQYDEYIRSESDRIIETTKGQITSDLQNFSRTLAPNKEFMECLVDVVARSFIKMEPDADSELRIDNTIKPGVYGY